MSNNSPHFPRKGNDNISETKDKKPIVHDSNIPNDVQECINSINSKLESLLTLHDELKIHLINATEKAAISVHDLEIVKQFANDYKRIAVQLISTSGRFIELIEQQVVILVEDLQREQKIRDELEKSLDKVSSQDVVVEDAAKLYFLTEINESKSLKRLTDSKELLLKGHLNLGATSFNTINKVCEGFEDHRSLRHVTINSRELLKGHLNLGATSFNTINETSRGYEDYSYVDHVNSLCRVKDEKQDDIKSRALEAYNQYILVFPVITRTNGGAGASGRRQRRSSIPERPQNSTLNMWSVMKNSIGKDLSRIPLPVNFSEPISALQRLVECLEYSQILDRAAECSDALEQLAYVAAFYVSGYSTNANRTAKPFNPLLGETFEWDRTKDDYGWRVIAEQVSHHPPISALHCKGREWSCWEEFSVVTRFRGRYLTAEPRGSVHLEFNKHNGHRYTWKKVNTTIHNIVIGKIYVEQNGEVDVIDHTNGAKCRISFLPNGGYFGGRDCKNRVFGTVRNTSGEVKWLVDGVWDKYVEIGAVIGVEGTTEKPVYKTERRSVVWECTPLPANSEKQYNFTLFARQLNEMDDDVAPTDSRRRPDQRLMEEGNWDEANVVKGLLEQKQRDRRTRNSSADSEASQAVAHSINGHQPVWFKQEYNAHTRESMYVYQNGYWEAKQKQDWSMCPNIFSTV